MASAKRCADLSEHIPLEIHEVPTGTQVFDWTVPKEWNIRDAWVKNSAGEKVDRLSPLEPARRQLQCSRSSQNAAGGIARTLAYIARPTRIGFRTAHRITRKIGDSAWRPTNWRSFEMVNTKSASTRRWRTGRSLTANTIFRAGGPTRCYCRATPVTRRCATTIFPGVALVASLAELLSDASLEYSYRFLFIPGTIGSITWLARNEQQASRIRHGLVVACVGDAGKFPLQTIAPRQRRDRPGRGSRPQSASGEPIRSTRFLPLRL